MLGREGTTALGLRGQCHQPPDPLKCLNPAGPLPAGSSARPEQLCLLRVVTGRGEGEGVYIFPGCTAQGCLLCLLCNHFLSILDIF